MSADSQHLWRQYLDVVPDADSAQRWFYQCWRISDDAQRADDGALLVTRGVKTATSSLLWVLKAQHKPLPQVGSLSILQNGRDEPVAVLQTTQLTTRPFREVDTRFAYDHGEWDRTLKTWRLQCWQVFAAQCATLGRQPEHTMPVICEHFRVVHRP
jgi:uncharacterized protein YhfF